MVRRVFRSSVTWVVAALAVGLALGIWLSGARGITLQDPAVGLAAGVIFGALFTTVVSFIAGELRARWAEDRQEARDAAMRRRQRHMDELMATRAWCLAQIARMTAKADGDKDRMLRAEDEIARNPDGMPELLGDRDAMLAFDQVILKFAELPFGGRPRATLIEALILMRSTVLTCIDKQVDRVERGESPISTLRSREEILARTKRVAEV